MNKGLKSVYSVILAISIILNTFSFVQATDLQNDDCVWYESDSLKEEPLNYEYQLLPEVVSQERALSEGIVSRIDTDKDPQNVIKYLMDDGSLPTIVFPVDVKYVDYNNMMRDKSNKLYEIEKSSGVYSKDNKKYEYYNKDNDIITKYPSFIDTGVCSTYNDYTINIYPYEAFVSKATMDNNIVLYKNVFGDGIDLEYSSSFVGYKEDIMLNRKGNINTFKFVVETNGLELKQSNAGCSFYQEGEIVAELGNIIVKDSNSNVDFGQIECKEIEQREQYLITIIVREEFLNDANTIYPVYVDPCLIFVTNHKYGGNNIVDCQMDSFSCGTGGTLTQYPEISFAYTGTSTFTSAIMKFPNLLPIVEAMGSNFTSASLYLYRSSDYYGSNDVYLYASPLTRSWTLGSTLSASSYSTLYNAYDSTMTVRSKIRAGARANGANAFSLTQMIQALQNGSYISNMEFNGIKLHISSYIANAYYYGASTSYSSYMPRIMLYYNDSEAPGIVSGGIYKLAPFSSKTQISNYTLTKSMTSLKINTGSVAMRNYPTNNSGYQSYMYDLNQLFKITYTGYGYTIQSLANNQYLKGTGNNLDFVSSDDSENYLTRWFIIQVGTRYYICDYFYEFLCALSPSVSNSNVTLGDYTVSDGTFWSIQLYSNNVAHRKQQTTNTCGAATVGMILEHLGGPYLSDATIYAQAGQASTEGYQAALNYYTIAHFGQSMYEHKYIPSGYTLEILSAILMQNINAGYPVILHIKIDLKTFPFNYTTKGHYLLLTGIYKDNAGTYRAVLYDPHYNTDPSVAQSLKTPALVDVTLSFIKDKMKSSTAIRNIE